MGSGGSGGRRNGEEGEEQEEGGREEEQHSRQLTGEREEGGGEEEDPMLGQVTALASYTLGLGQVVVGTASGALVSAAGGCESSNTNTNLLSRNLNSTATQQGCKAVGHVFWIAALVLAAAEATAVAALVMLGRGRGGRRR